MNNQAEPRQVVLMPAPPGMSWEGTQPQQDDEIDLLALWNVIWRRKFFILSFTLMATLAAVYWTLFVIPVTYQSQAVLLPTGTGDKTGGLAGLASSLPIPLSLPGGGGGGSQLIMAFLDSQNLKLKLINNYDLLPRIYKTQWDPEKKSWLATDLKQRPTIIKAIQGKVLEGSYKATQDKKTQMVTLTWVDEDPAFAAQMLQRVIDELNNYLTNEYESDAKRERKFVEKELAGATVELEFWEQQVPTDELSLAKIKRELLASGTVYTELRKQVELAKLTEEKEVVNFKTIDPPFIPEIRFKPKRSQICALTLVTAGFMALLLVFMQEAIAKRKTDAG